MTANQIAYWANVERERSNRANEYLTSKKLDEERRSNIANEKELNRSNVAREGETWRSNVAREGETFRHNIADEALTRRRNQIETGKALTQLGSAVSKSITDALKLALG